MTNVAVSREAATRTLATVATLAVALLLVPVRAAQPTSEYQSPSRRIGLLPVYDGSGEGYGEAFARHLTSALFEALSEGGYDYFLLNPGGLYSPLDEASLIDFARSAGVAGVVVPALGRTIRERRDDGKPEIAVEIRVLDVEAARWSGALVRRREVKRKDLERGFDAGYGGTPSRRLAKQPLGKTVLTLADELRPMVTSALATAGYQPTPLPKTGRGSCRVTFRIRYAEKQSASKLYNVIINDREESIGVRDGALELEADSGPLVVEASVEDEPYRLPVQPLYFANTFLDCGRPERTLTLEIGGAGEAFLVWR